MKSVAIFCMLAMAGLYMLYSCRKKEVPPVPIVNVPVLGVVLVKTVPTINATVLEGIIESNGGEAITKQGYVYSETNKVPTLLDSKTEIGAVTGPFPAKFSGEITGLKANTTYYIRAYASNSVGTGYSTVQEVKTVALLAPVIASFRPASGEADEQVVITGTNFNTILGNNTVKFNGKTAKIVAGNATTLTVEVPEKAGIGTVTVETNAQVATSGTVFNFRYSAKTEKVAGGFKYPQSLAMDGKGNIYVADRLNGQIKMIKPDGSVVKIAGTTAVTQGNQLFNVNGNSARFAVVTGLTVDAKWENLYVADENAFAGATAGFILKIDLTNSNYFVQKLGPNVTGHPTAIKIDEANKLLYINHFTKDAVSGFVSTMNTDGTGFRIIIGNSSTGGFNPVGAGEIDGLSARLKGVAGGFLSKDGRRYYFAEEHNHAIRVYDVASKKVKTLAGTGIASTNNPFDPISNSDVTFDSPTGIALDSEGRIYVTEWKGQDRLRVYDPKSDKWQTVLSNLRDPYTVIVNDKDELFISEWRGDNDSVLKVTIK